MADCISTVPELLRALDLAPGQLPPLLTDRMDFPLRVPRRLLARMQPGDPQDPLLLQVLPLTQEQQFHHGYSLDPVGDLAASRGHGLLHKYQGRALLIASGACAIHCRYCFRRHFPYQQQTLRQSQLDQAVAAVAGDPSLSEIILSGGDPLTLDAERLAALLQQLDALPHLQRLRIHSRVPVVIPERLDETLLGQLTALRMQTVLVIHVNHRNEIDDCLRQRLRDYQRYGITLLNQSVLLQGINDDARTLAELSLTLFECGVMPYYLHQLDRAQGCAHFEVDEPRSRAIYHQLLQQLPGYLVPRLVHEQVGRPYKQPLSPLPTP
ncbi:MAG: EF-P beta-lysylation protein EpmB [Gammaproteobacteria bacterium]|nr:EF-P beta-lysylation protein EpmB [Gammaproteobacteria bacterium]